MNISDKILDYPSDINAFTNSSHPIFSREPLHDQQEEQKIHNQDLLRSDLQDVSKTHHHAFTILKFEIDRFLRVFPRADQITCVNVDDKVIHALKNLLESISYYFQIQEEDIFDLIEYLVNKNILTVDSGQLIKKSCLLFDKIKSIRTLKIRDGGIVEYDKKTAQDFIRCYWLTLYPLYQVLRKVGSEETFLKTFFLLDLVHISFHSSLNSLSKTLIKQIALHLCENSAPTKVHLHYFKVLSELGEERLREVYLSVLGKQRRDETVLRLLEVPNRAGLRLGYLRNMEKFKTGLFAITDDINRQSPEEAIICITAPHFSKPRYLKPSISQEILNGHNLEQCENGFHSVCSFSHDGYHFHLKQQPSSPLMEAAIHSLTFRIAGRYTPATTLVRFDVEIKGVKKSYPVLISETIEGENLSKAYPSFQPNKSYTWALLMAILTLPGDGKSSNFVVDKQNNLFSIDNDIAFVEPITKEYGFRTVNFCSIPFCLFPLHTPLDKKVLQRFISLDVQLILSSWLGEIAEKEQEYLNLFSVEERDRLYSEDIEKSFTPRILFREGAIARLQLQFWLLQNSIAEALQQQQQIYTGDLLKQIISSREESVGSYIHKAYNKDSATPMQKLQLATSRQDEGSLTSVQHLQVALGTIPTAQEIEAAKKYSINQAREELFSISCTRSSLFGSVHKNLNGLFSLKNDLFKLINAPKRQLLVIDTLLKLFQDIYPKPQVITIINSTVLDTKLLTPFLHELLESLDLRNCSKIDNSTVRLISTNCPHLKKLTLAGCSKITDISDLFYDRLVFPHLIDLDVSRCTDLKSIKIEALALQTLKATQTRCKSKYTSFLDPGSIDLVSCSAEVKFDSDIYTAFTDWSYDRIREQIFFRGVPQLKEEGVRPSKYNRGRYNLLGWGKQLWKYVSHNTIDYVPPLPSNITEILNSPCPFTSEKKVKDTHKLILRPKFKYGSSLDIAFFKRIFRSNDVDCEIDKDFKISSSPIDYPESYWFLMYIHSPDENYNDEISYLRTLNQKVQHPYELCNVEELLSAIALESAVFKTIPFYFEKKIFGIMYASVGGSKLGIRCSNKPLEDVFLSGSYEDDVITYHYNAGGSFDPGWSNTYSIFKNKQIAIHEEEESPSFSNREAFKQIACCMRLMPDTISMQETRLTEMILAGQMSDSYFHGTTSHVLKVFNGTLRTAKDLEHSASGRQSGEGDFFSSGEGNEKEYVALGLSHPGLALGFTYAMAHKKFINYNPELYPDKQLNEEIQLLDIILSHWNEDLNQLTEDSIGLKKSLGKFSTLASKLKREQTARIKLHRDHPRRSGKVYEDSAYPVLFEISGEELETVNPRSSVTIKDDEMNGRAMGGERFFRGNINLKKEGRLKRIFVPKGKITETKTALRRKGFQIDKIEFFALEAITDQVLGKNLGPNVFTPDLGAYGTKIYTEETMVNYEDIRNLLLHAYAKGMCSGQPVDDALIRSLGRGAYDVPEIFNPEGKDKELVDPVPYPLDYR